MQNKSASRSLVFSLFSILLFIAFALTLPFINSVFSRLFPKAKFFASGGTVLNVQTCGAIPGDGKDDFAAIQACINKGVSGDTVYFPSGTYDVRLSPTKYIALKTGVSLSGDGKTSTIQAMAGTGNWGWMFKGDVSNIEIHDLHFDSNIAKTNGVIHNDPVPPDVDVSSYQVGIQVDEGQNINIHHNFFDWSGVWAVGIGVATQYTHIDHNYVNFTMNLNHPDYDNSQFYMESKDYTMLYNEFHATPNPGKEARAAMEAHGGPGEVAFNKVYGYQTLTYVTSSYLNINPGAMRIHDNFCDRCAFAISIWPVVNMDDVKVYNNTINIDWLSHGPDFIDDAAGIYVQHGNEEKQDISNLEILNNTVTFQSPPNTGSAFGYPTNTVGIGALGYGGVNGLTISGNTITNAPGPGITIGFPPGTAGKIRQNITITNNSIHNAGNGAYPNQYKSGVYLGGIEQNVTVINNLIDGAATVNKVFRDPNGTFTNVITTPNNGLAVTPTVTAPIVKTGDINRDTQVDLSDLSLLAIDWGRTGTAISNPKADLNQDGKIDLTDFSLLAANWGK